MKRNDDTIQDTDEVQDETVKDTAEQEEVTEQEIVQDEWENKYKRALADYQNLEKRVAVQRRELILSASRGILERLLPVLDTLLLAQQHSDDKGLQVSIQQFLDVLKSEGVEKIEAKGKNFDPSIMEAVGTQDGDEGKVIEEVRVGYTLHETLLRPAQVIVGSGKKAEK